MEAYPPPSDALVVQDLKVNGHTVSYNGTNAVTFRVDEQKRCFICGENTNAITIDGVTTTFADQPVALVAWGPIHESRRVEAGAVAQVLVHGGGTVHIPVPGVNGAVELVAQGNALGSRGDVVAGTLETRC